MRNPTIRRLTGYDWRLRTADIPDHSCIELHSRVQIDEPADETERIDEGPSERVLLRCNGPNTTEPPLVPGALEGWLGRDWDDCQARPEPIASRNQRDAETGETVVVQFVDDSNRVEALSAYRSMWDAWATTERITVEAGKVFE